MMVDLLDDPTETLRDLVQVWPADRARLGTSELLVRLARLRPAAYSTWSVESLARRLQALGVPSVLIQTNEGPDGPRVRRGVTYRDLWERYLVLWEPRHPMPRQGPLSAAAWAIVQVGCDVLQRVRRGRGHRR